MNAQTTLTTPPEVLTLYRGMDDLNRHRVLQLLIREFDYAFDEFDAALSAAATELHPNREDLQGALYPIGLNNLEASRRHRIDLERSVVAAERYASGRAGMLAGRTEPMPATAAAWRAF